MRSIQQKETYYINVKERDSGQEIGCIQISTRTRVTERDALQSPFLPNRDTITDKPPSSEHIWCSGGHFAKRVAFGLIRGKRDHYCRQCRAEQQAKWRETRRR